MACATASLPPRLTLLVVDDHPLIRQGLRSLVATAVDELEFLEAASAAEARQHLESASPDVITIDLLLPDTDGIDLIRELRENGVKAPILVLSMYGESAYAERALRAGASGYVMKEEVGAVLLGALRRVLSGELHLSAAAARGIAGRLFARPGTAGSLPALLTDRELEVWRQLGAGRSTRQIASRLNISPKTVETHCYNIRQKTGLPNMTALVHAATRWLHGHERRD